MVHGINGGGSNPLGGITGVGSVGSTTPAAGTTSTPAPAAAPGTTRAGGLAATASGLPTSVPGELIKKLAAADTGNTVDLLSKPTSVTSTTVVYRMGGSEGRQLKPNDQIYLEIPPQFRGRPVYMAVFAHRQTQSDKTSTPEDKGGKKWDNTPGSTALHFHSTGAGDEGWRYWNAPWGSSGKQGGKYAELRSGGDPENETEFEFMKNGTTSVSGGGRSTKPLEIDALRLRSVGTDPTRVHSVLVTFMPPKPDTTQEVIFSPGTSMGDPYTAAGRSYGKDKGKGTYPGALTLGWGGAGGEGAVKLAAQPGWKLENGGLSIELTPGKKFTGVEVACGDTHPDGKHNSDGETGTQGWSKLSMGIQRKGSSSVDWFTQSQGVPPQGVIFGGPNIENYVAQPGDKLIIRAESDTTYVMGVRTWYNN
jgi:hypothetical protein